ncbi:restriction endonuclease subunit S [Pseudomonas sp. OTU750018]|uniref:restriction endonuclease subunit S n=1 Tax=Pseudomonas sp. OTU750018 TaxID=2709708 RepID=UPI00141FC93C|nr:restriction endonuclease subunit S [Pseudomonas sp. OTU750018]
MSFPRYPEYKDSGVEWLGKVPGHWHISKLKHFTHFVGGGTPSRDKLEFWNGDIPWVSPKDMKSERITGAEECITEEGLLSSSSSLIAKDRVLMVVRSGILKHTIPVAINDVPVALNQDMKALKFAREKCLSSFFWRWVQGLNDRLLLAWSKPGATVDSIEHDYLAETRIPLPPIDEQLQITLFLERETAKIDDLMAEQEKLIALLKEKRQAVIAHAVTKGLDPTVPMKESGIEWLGTVPESWDVKRLSSISTKITNGYVGPTRDILLDEGVRYLQSLHIKKNEIRFNEPYFVSLQWSLDHQKSILQTGDVLIVQTGDIGQVAVVTEEFEGCNCHALIIVSPLRTVILGEWLSWVLNSEYGFHSLLSIQTGALHPHLNCGNVKELFIPVPPLETQAEAVKYLATETSKFDELISTAQSAIDLLKERRTALISAAVTGQIDVRGLIKDEQEQAA